MGYTYFVQLLNMYQAEEGVADHTKYHIYYMYIQDHRSQLETIKLA